ncbi:hypothetical protein A2397_04760 [Candidatus Amesbacteria bacterium RIFOXYB1_FULL_44_23]|uniref:UDP-N-acetylmuramoylalanine--D-glutamate ligase n=1 Tax=Candidatus Amesbacteria bacterium RIFOXYB1_FULL_44_23 TaxID=1797263 RepID=A0A1F4ZU13_9BACT|nr:MAG: hypothetical protein A2397_04760 [Candidatus Amesbacteria bacterium RIFOXYB1_FULL_44_23]
MTHIIDQISHLDKILILGFAREGQSTERFLKQRFPHLKIDTSDQKDNPDYLKHLQEYKLVIKTPGISPHKPEIVAAKKNGVIFSSHTQLFFEVCPSKNIIGITGTKGKSTTTSIIYEVLKANHKPAVLVGNIGKPALDFLSDISPNTWVVMELSSYQLMDMSASPHIAVLQNIYPDHLDYHSDFAEYKNAKLNITKYQTANDYLITQLDVPTKAKKTIFSISDFDPQVKTKLIGDHNKLNIIPILKISDILKLSKTLTYQAIENFQPLETRLELVATKNGIGFYADTLATIPQATIAAIDGLSSEVETLIAGGHDRKQNYSDLAKKILNSNIKNLILFPATGSRIWEEVSKLEPRSINHFAVTNMSDAVKIALHQTTSGKICLLSPAAPSFTLFKDYHDEYEQYKKFIEQSQ